MAKGSSCCAAYEQLRRLSLEAPCHARGRWGMALFVGRGFVAWMHAWEQVATTPNRREKVCSEQSASTEEALVLPEHMHTRMVVTLAGMVLDALGGEAA